MLKAFDVSLYLLSLARRDGAGETISNLKMQKMLYYAQGYFLALVDKPLFSERIEAWEHGPVVREIYDRFKKYGNLAIDFSELEAFNSLLYNDLHVDILPFVFKKYSRFSAWDLREKTHRESPWLDAYQKYFPQEITKEAIKKFFTTKIEKEAMGYLA